MLGFYGEVREGGARLPVYHSTRSKCLRYRPSYISQLIVAFSHVWCCVADVKSGTANVVVERTLGEDRRPAADVVFSDMLGKPMLLDAGAVSETPSQT